MDISQAKLREKARDWVQGSTVGLGGRVHIREAQRDRRLGGSDGNCEGWRLEPPEGWSLRIQEQGIARVPGGAELSWRVNAGCVLPLSLIIVAGFEMLQWYSNSSVGKSPTFS
ncbi:unnamed protein product [Calypogeia fissa]